MDVGLQLIKVALESATVEISRALCSHIGSIGCQIDKFTEMKIQQKQKKNRKTNVSGDAVHVLDELADKMFETALRECSVIAGFASEEQTHYVEINPQGEYIVVFDPLDGSQNVAPSLSVGSIFGIFKKQDFADIHTGRDMVAAGYAVYSASLTFAFCTTTTPLTLSQYDFENEEWVEYESNHKQPKKGKTYAINEGNSANWDSTIQSFVGNHLRGRRSVRWMCCMVADVHRQIIEGGCYMYPCDTKYPKGRLRLLYEAAPLAFIWERIGNGVALATTDGEAILDVLISDDAVHERCGVILLGDDEARQFERVKVKNPTWAGGHLSLERRLQEKREIEEKSKSSLEVSLLRGAVVVGVVVQLYLIYQNRQATSQKMR